MERLEERAFLIKIDANTFVKRVDGNEILTSTVPSACPAMTYDEADSIARLLRRRKYFSNTYVCDLTGQPITGAMLREAQTQTQADEQLPRTHAELDAIPAREQQRLCKQSPAFQARYNELESQPRVAPKAAK